MYNLIKWSSLRSRNRPLLAPQKPSVYSFLIIFHPPAPHPKQQLSWLKGEHFLGSWSWSFFFNGFCHLYVFLKTISLVLPALKLYINGIIQYISSFAVMFIFVIHSFLLLFIFHCMKCCSLFYSYGCLDCV